MRDDVLTRQRRHVVGVHAARADGGDIDPIIGADAAAPALVRQSDKFSRRRAAQQRTA